MTIKHRLFFLTAIALLVSASSIRADQATFNVHGTAIFVSQSTTSCPNTQPVSATFVTQRVLVSGQTRDIDMLCESSQVGTLCTPSVWLGWWCSESNSFTADDFETGCVTNGTVYSCNPLNGGRCRSSSGNILDSETLVITGSASVGGCQF